MSRDYGSSGSLRRNCAKRTRRRSCQFFDCLPQILRPQISQIEPENTVRVAKNGIEPDDMVAVKSFSSNHTHALVEEIKLSGKNVLRLHFTKLEVAGKHSFSRDYNFHLCPIGQGRLPSRINGYLLDTVLILCGDGFLRRNKYSGFGFVDAYQLLLGEPEEIAKVLEEALDIAIRLTEDRVVAAATQGQGRLERIAVSGAPKIGYSPKDFEKDIFYILKRMFPYSERWGREGQRESDGIIPASVQGDTYFVASYDPKLTTDESGYDLNAEQQNKAAYYILSENLNERILRLTGDRGINAHIIISNAFKRSSVPSFGAGISRWIRLFDTKEVSPIKVPIILLPLEQLLSLYGLFNEHWDLIKGNVQFHRKFLEYVMSAFHTEEQCSLITSQLLEQVRESIIELKRTTKLTQPMLPI